MTGTIEPLNSAALRAGCRDGTFDGPTSGHALGSVQANMVILPAEFAAEFRDFCDKNPKPCPVLEVHQAGDPETKMIAPGADVRTDLPRYRVFRDGHVVDEPTDIRDLWRDDLVTFMLGCSFIVEEALMASGLMLPHIAETGTVPMYRTDRQCVPAGRFSGPVVVSMRPFTPDEAIRAADITQHFPMAHGAPIHTGDPAGLGIADIAVPDYGRAVTCRPDQVPVFWACGVTPQEAFVAARPPLAITHAPGHMFVADISSESTRI